MYFIRYFNNSEPERTRFAVYKCGLCGHIDNFRANGDNWTEDEKRCPKCKALNGGDKLEQLSTNKIFLEDQIKSLRDKLDTVEAEMEIIESQHVKDAT